MSPVAGVSGGGEVMGGEGGVSRAASPANIYLSSNLQLASNLVGGAGGWEVGGEKVAAGGVNKGLRTKGRDGAPGLTYSHVNLLDAQLAYCRIGL